MKKVITKQIKNACNILLVLLSVLYLQSCAPKTPPKQDYCGILRIAYVRSLAAMGGGDAEQRKQLVEQFAKREQLSVEKLTKMCKYFSLQYEN